jgi:hypothetical protein
VEFSEKNKIYVYNKFDDLIKALDRVVFVELFHKNFEIKQKDKPDLKIKVPDCIIIQPKGLQSS